VHEVVLTPFLHITVAVAALTPTTAMRVMAITTKLTVLMIFTFSLTGSYCLV